MSTTAPAETEQPRGLRRLLTTFANLMAAELMTRGLLLASQLIVVRILGPDAFGAYVYAISAALLVGLVLEFGLTPLVIREASAEQSRAPRLLSAFLGAQAILGIAAIAISASVLLFGDPTGPATVGELAIAFGAMAVNALSRPFEATLVAVAKTELVTVSRTIRGGVLLVATIVAWAIDATPASFILAVVASEVAGTVSVALLSRTQGLEPQRGIGRSDIWGLLRLAVPFALVAALNILYLRVDVLMLGWLASDADVGNYGAAARVYETAVVVPAFFGSAFLATVTDLGVGSVEARAHTAQALRIIVLVCTPLTIVLAAAAEPVLGLVIGSDYTTAPEILVRLSPMLLLIASYGVLTSVQVARDRIRVIGAINLAGVVLKVGVNLWAIPAHGVFGAAVTATAVEAVVVVLQWHQARDIVDVQPVLVAFARTLAAGAAMLGCVIVLDGVSLVLALAAGIAVFGVVAFLTRAVSHGEVRLVVGALRPAPGGRS